MKTLACTLCLFVCYFSHAQLSVDSVRTEADVETFIYQFGKEKGFYWSNMSVHGLKSSAENKYQKRLNDADSLSSPKWLVVDFNSDGKKDLIFNGIINDEKILFSFLSDERSNYHFFNLTKQSYKNFPVNISVVKIKSTVFLVLKESFSTWNGEKSTLKKRMDTLMAVANGFIEKPSAKYKKVILDYFSFESEPYEYGRRRWAIDGEKIAIQRDSLATYERSYQKFENDRTDDLAVKFSSKLNAQTINELNQLLTLMDIRNMKDSFFVNSNHYPTARITVKFDKQVKHIYDYGFEGTYGLRLLYNKLLLIIMALRHAGINYLSEGESWHD